jgi:hypothetical protein
MADIALVASASSPDTSSAPSEPSGAVAELAANAEPSEAAEQPSEAPVVPEHLARARAAAARKLAEQNARRQAQQQTGTLQQQLAEAHAKILGHEKLVAELRAQAARAQESPIERWMREGKTPEQAREEIARLADPTFRKLAELEQRDREREEALAKERKAFADREAAARQSAHRKQVEAEFLGRVEAAPEAYPHLVDLPPRMIVAAGYDLLAEYVEECQARGDRRTREQITSQDFSDPDSDARLLSAINRRIEERATARKAKGASKPIDAALPQGSPGPAAGKAPPATSRSSAPLKAKPIPSDLDKLDWDNLSDKEQFAIMGAHVQRTGALKAKPKPTR